MIRVLLDFCIRERLIVFLLAIALLLFGWYSTKVVPLDAIPNVGENQVIVLTEWMGRSPKDIEDQITYPLSVALQAVPGSKSVRGKSMFGFSFVQVTFDDDVDFHVGRVGFQFIQPLVYLLSIHRFSRPIEIEDAILATMIHQIECEGTFCSQLLVGGPFGDGIFEISLA